MDFFALYIYIPGCQGVGVPGHPASQVDVCDQPARSTKVLEERIPLCNALFTFTFLQFPKIYLEHSFLFSRIQIKPSAKNGSGLS